MTGGPMRWTVLALLLAFTAPPDAARLALSRAAGPLAIKNATVVGAPGQSIERASILLRNGLIENVGAQVEVPRDAEAIDGTGLVVYAGFIDGRSTIGLPDMKRSPEQQRAEEGVKPDFT